MLRIQVSIFWLCALKQDTGKRLCRRKDILVAVMWHDLMAALDAYPSTAAKHDHLLKKLGLRETQPIEGLACRGLKKPKKRRDGNSHFLPYIRCGGYFPSVCRLLAPFSDIHCVIVDTNALNLILACPTNYTYQPSANSRLGLSWVKRDETRWRVVCTTCYGVGSGSKEEAHFRIIIMMQNFEKCLLSGWGEKMLPGRLLGALWKAKIFLGETSRTWTLKCCIG